MTALPAPRLARAQQLLASGQVDQAEALLMLELEDPASRAEVNYLLAIAAVMGQRAAVAVDHARAAIDAAPRVARYWFVLGRAFKAAGEVDGAIHAYRRAIELDARHAEAHVSLGIALKHSGRFDEAIACYETAIAINPSLGVAHANLANAQAARAEAAADPGVHERLDGVDDGLLESTQRALALDPGNALMQRNHGVLLLRAGRRQEAGDAFNRALGLNPGDVECCMHLGLCLRALGRHEHAIVLYEKWLGINPPAAPVMRLLSNLLTVVGRADEALHWAERAVALDGDAAAYSQLGNALHQCRRLEEAVSALERSVALSNQHPAFYPLLLLFMNYLHEDPQPIFERHAEFGRVLARTAPARPPWRSRVPGARLRVGYVSGDFMQHSVSYFVSPLLERHDTQRFEVYCYYNRAFGDAVTERLRALGHHWIECDGLSDAQLAQRIRADGIDVMVDLSGHTASSRLAMLQHGAAPVQIAYLGYPTVSGVQAVDFRITDRTIDPGDMPQIASDEPLCLPRSMFCYRPAAAPQIGPPPVQRKGVITFGSFNNLAKLSQRTLRLWARVMHAVPGSRLLLKSASMGEASNRQSIGRFMAALDIDPVRLTLQAQVAESRSHLELYNEVDVALDTFPYNGATTTCEALWMGVPVVSLRGRTHTSRMGASILRAAGRAEWVADDEPGFIGTAARLAADLPALAHWRAQARELLAASELFDEAGFTAGFEAALEQAWWRVDQRTAGARDA